MACIDRASTLRGRTPEQDIIGVSHSLSRQVACVFLGHATAMILQFLLPVLLVRIMPMQAFGLYQQFSNVTITLLSALNLGMTTSLLFFFPSVAERERSLFITQTYWVLLCIGGLVTGLLLILHVQVAGFLQGVLTVPLLAVVVTTGLVTSFSEVIFILEKRHWYSLLVPIAEQVMRVFAIVGGVLLLRGATGAIVGVALYSVVRYALMSAYLHLRYSVLKPRFNRATIAQQFIYSLPFGMSVILRTLAQRIDKVLTIAMLSPEQYGIYSVAFFSIPILSAFYEAIFKSILPLMSHHASKNDLVAVAKLWQSAIARTSAVSVPFIVLAWLLAEPIVTMLFTESYAAAVPFYRVYILTLAIQMLGAGLILRACNRTRLTFWSNLVSAAVTILSALILTRAYGIWGAVATAIVGAVLPNVMQLLYETRMLSLSIVSWLPISQWGKQLFICAVVGLPVWKYGRDSDLQVHEVAIIGGGFLFVVLLVQEIIGVSINPQFRVILINHLHARFRPRRVPMER